MDNDFEQKTFCTMDYDGNREKTIEAKKRWVKQKRSEGYQVESHKMSPQIVDGKYTTCWIANAQK